MFTARIEDRVFGTLRVAASDEAAGSIAEKIIMCMAAFGDYQRGYKQYEHARTHSALSYTATGHYSVCYSDGSKVHQSIFGIYAAKGPVNFWCRSPSEQHFQHTDPHLWMTTGRLMSHAAGAGLVKLNDGFMVLAPGFGEELNNALWKGKPNIPSLTAWIRECLLPFSYVTAFEEYFVPVNRNEA